MISVTHDETGVLNVWMLELLKKNFLEELDISNNKYY